MEIEKEEFIKFLDLFIRIINKQQQFNRKAIDYGTGVPLYFAEINILAVIDKNPGIIGSRLGEFLGITRSAVSQLLGKLEQKKLIIKTGKNNNEKEKIPVITQLGKETVKAFNHYRLHFFLPLKKQIEIHGEKYKKQVVELLYHIDKLMDKKINR